MQQKTSPGMGKTSMQLDPEVQHLIPHDVKCKPVEVSLVIPALNEEITVGEFVEWCKEGLSKAGVEGQILIVDSSTDKTPEIALAHGAEVLKVPKRGLGRAYIDAIPYIRGKYVIMGDADLTYDFRETRPFLEKFREGYEFIMGSRFKGKIEDGAMPKLHRYFGTPVTTKLLNFMFGTRFSDIHCGMRGVTLDGLTRMNLKSQTWQYASEMIIKALHLDLKTSEVPVFFYKDREGRSSHLKRIGWLAPWHAGWITIQTMFTYGADFFLFKPGLLLFILGLIGITLVYNGPRSLGPVTLSLHSMLFFLLCSVVGIQFCFMGILAKAIYDSEKRLTPRWRRYFGFNRSFLLSGLLIVLGLFHIEGLVSQYIANGLRLPPELGTASFRAVAGIGLLFGGVIYFTFALVYNALLTSKPDKASVRENFTIFTSARTKKPYAGRFGLERFWKKPL